ncbi:hypothetical protein YSY34_27370 [Brevibacillus brevis]
MYPTATEYVSENYYLPIESLRTDEPTRNVRQKKRQATVKNGFKTS